MNPPPSRVSRLARRRLAAAGRNAAVHPITLEADTPAVRELAGEIRSATAGQGEQHRVPLLRIHEVLEDALPKMRAHPSADIQLLLKHYHHKLYLSTDSSSDYLAALALLASSGARLGSTVGDMVKQSSQVIMDSLHNASLKKSTAELANLDVLLNALAICARLHLRGCPPPDALPRRIASVICKEQFADKFVSEVSPQDAWTMLRSLAAIGSSPPAALFLLDRYFDREGRIAQLSRVKMVQMVEALCKLRSRGPALQAVCDHLATQIVKITPQQRLALLRSFATINVAPNLLYLFLGSGRRWRLKLSASSQAEMLSAFAELRFRPRGSTFFKDLILTVLRGRPGADPLRLCYDLFLLDMFDEPSLKRLETTINSPQRDEIPLEEACRVLASLGYFCYGQPSTYDALLGEIARFEASLYQNRQCLVQLKSLEIGFRIGHSAFPISNLSPSAQQTLLRVRHAEVADLSRDAAPTGWTQDIRRIAGQVCNRTYFNITVGPFLVDFVRTSDGTPQTKLDKGGDERLQAVRQCVGLEPLKGQCFYRGSDDSELTSSSKYRHILLRGLGIEVCPVSRQQWVGMTSDAEKVHYLREVVTEGMARLKERRKEHARKISQIKWQKRVHARSVS
ncbi:hypothetical protein FOZ63_031448 [Perkinsus olseni]|uniref:RAP domain-containing protein n=2 Tax=Perkinsus olseni TaxID=32597 RepID=A0A7J6RP63_PEROL|nr:hypothetical protein FOZ63_031448 [Perkinsus olseni]